MGSLAAAVPAPAVHASWWARSVAWVQKIGHEIVHGLKAAGAEAPKIAAAVNAALPTFEAVSNLIVPGSGSIEALAADALGHFLQAVQGAGDVAGAISITTPLGTQAIDAAFIAQVKAILPSLERFLHPNASPAPAPKAPPAAPAA